ncbi:hypothetical protein B0H11DRAFT_1902540 [Mycena galericulata]|nr:hypothetical protein B0H11DRAFT_1934728 [Mycena galericulata]KAJ7475491.1 hypothetical protein B0H11DRAFT_1917674 [Mycena galericulata]KAJ7508225.1 hypothetical protein B0H11DRAFT_1902540 [Mycena galericulata]
MTSNHTRIGTAMPVATSALRAACTSHRPGAIKLSLVQSGPLRACALEIDSPTNPRRQRALCITGACRVNRQATRDERRHSSLPQRRRRHRQDLTTPSQEVAQPTAERGTSGGATSSRPPTPAAEVVSIDGPLTHLQAVHVADGTTLTPPTAQQVKQRRSRNTPYLNGFDGERQHSLHFRNASTIAFYHYDIDSTRQLLSGLLGRASLANKGLLYAFTPCLHNIAWASTPYNNDIEITNLSIAPPRLFRRPCSTPTTGESCSPAVRRLCSTQSGFKADIPTHRGTKVLNLAFKSLSTDTTLVPLLQLKSPRLALTYLAHELRTPSCIDQQRERHFEDIHNTSPTTELLEPLTP